MTAKINFQYETIYGKFEDALWFSDIDPMPLPQEIEAMKLQRLNNWLEIVTPKPLEKENLEG